MGQHGEDGMRFARKRFGDLSTIRSHRRQWHEPVSDACDGAGAGGIELESHLRSILKSVTYRCGGLFVTGLIALLITRRVELAVWVALADTVAKIGVFYLHERMWLRIEFGRRRRPDYEI
jgi:uncharacterized membrane protein